MSALRFLDLVALALALPLFLVADWPLVGYAGGGGAWLLQRGIQLVAERRAGTLLVVGNRRGALGLTAASTLARVWLLALAILLVGKLEAREDGLAAAVLCAVLVTAYLGAQAMSRLMATQPEAGS